MCVCVCVCGKKSVYEKKKLILKCFLRICFLFRSHLENFQTKSKHAGKIIPIVYSFNTLTYAIFEYLISEYFHINCEFSVKRTFSISYTPFSIVTAKISSIVCSLPYS